jgi:ACT domain-containing protein
MVDDNIIQELEEKGKKELKDMPSNIELEDDKDKYEKHIIYDSRKRKQVSIYRFCSINLKQIKKHLKCK